jgi:phasin family protein
MNEGQKEANKAAAQGRQMAETAEHAAQEGTRRIKDITNEAAEAGQHAVSAAAEAARVGAETMQHTLQTGLDATYKVAQRSTDQFMQVLGLSGQQSQELAQQSSQNVQAIANTSTVLARGFQDVVREWLNFTQSRLDENLDRVSALTTCRSIPDLVALQSDLIRENLEQMIDKGQQIMQQSTKVTHEAARTITAQSRTSASPRNT